MTAQQRLGIVTVMLLACTSLIFVSGVSGAGDEPDLKASILKIAKQIKSGDKTVGKSVAAAAKSLEDMHDLMHLFLKRKKDVGGLGWGTTPLADPTKDGLEVQLIELSKKAPEDFAKQAAAAEEAGYWIIAMAEVAKAKGWTEPEEGKKTKKAWNAFAEELRAASTAFTKVAAAKNAKEVQTAAAKLSNVCTQCHTVFKN